MKSLHNDTFNGKVKIPSIWVAVTESKKKLKKIIKPPWINILQHKQLVFVTNSMGNSREP